MGWSLGAAATGCLPVPEVCRQTAGEEMPASSPRSPLAEIDAFVVVMMENRSFDHHLGALARDRRYPASDAVDGLRGDQSNPDEQGRPVSSWRLASRGRLNPAHAWEPAHASWAGGRNDGFVRVNEGPHRDEVMSFHDRERLPVHYALADEFTVCDHWFASVMGPTWPNRFYLHAATSGGQRGNSPMGFGAPPTIWERMAERCQETKNYFAGPAPWYAAGFPAKAFSGNDAVTPARIEEFFRDAAAGNLPALSIIDPDFLSNDGHPVHDLALSEAFLAGVYRALAESPQWPGCLLVITYDEHGGFFDHVPPPQTADPRPEFRQLGFRVPALVVGPTVWSGRVVSATLEHVSIAATLATRFGMHSLGPRMDAARDLSVCIDPERAGRPGRATALPRVELTRMDTRAPMCGPGSQREIGAALAEGRVPERFADLRAPEERLRGWLRHAQDLGAVKVIA